MVKLFSSHTRSKYLISVLIIITILLYLLIVPFKSILPWSIQRNIEVIERIPASNFKLCLCNPTRTLIIKSHDNLKIVMDEYIPLNKPIIGNIIIIHGHTHLAGNLALYRVLAKNLADAGFATYVPDLPGFGRSDDPFSIRRKQPRDNTTDIITISKFVQKQQQSKNIVTSIIGHSRGATYVLKALTELADISSIILIGPPRRVSILAKKPHNEDKSWRRSEDTRIKVYGKGFPNWYTRDMWRKNYHDMEITKHLLPFKQYNHPPLTFIEGSLEPKDDRNYTKSVINKLKQPIGYQLISGADHYLNTIHIAFVAAYDSKIIKTTCDFISQFIQSNRIVSANQ